MLFDPDFLGAFLEESDMERGAGVRRMERRDPVRPNKGLPG